MIITFETRKKRVMQHLKLKGILNMMIVTAIFGAVQVQAGSTEHIPSVSGFDISRYLGVWYEIVRNDHRFERDLTHVTATYGDTGIGTFSIVNRGFNPEKSRWMSAAARGKYKVGSNLGELQVTFFWPFRARYRIIELGPEYEYAVVTSNSTKYFWILSRTPTMDSAIVNGILERAMRWGFDTARFIRVDQTSRTAPQGD